MMEELPKLKLRFAKEILIFFIGIVLLGIIWGFLAFRNLYYYDKTDFYSENIESLQIQLESLPQDYIKEFYEIKNKYFVVNYKIGKDIYAIPKEKEKNFLTDEYGIPRKVTLMPIYPKGYSYFRKSDSFNILYKDSIILFDYVSLEKFRDLIFSDDYQEKLYTVFSKRTDQEDERVFDLGTIFEFKDKIKSCFKYNQSRNEIGNVMKTFQEKISKSKSKILTSNEILNLLINSLIIIGFLLYPVRLSIVLIYWSIKTLKSKE